MAEGVEAQGTGEEQVAQKLKRTRRTINIKRLQSRVYFVIFEGWILTQAIIIIDRIIDCEQIENAAS